jgi:hypothetical protein
MPTSRPNHLTDLALTVVQENPADILDVGAGFGGKGVLFRESTDIWYQRYHKKDWTTRINAIEPFLQYLTPLHHYIYDMVYGMTVQEFLKIASGAQTYDFIYLGDVIEHMTESDGEDTLLGLSAICDKTIYISTPVVMHEQGTVLGNALEHHVTQWSPETLQATRMAKAGTWSFLTSGNVLVAKWRVS